MGNRRNKFSNIDIDGHLFGTKEAWIRCLITYLTDTAAERALSWMENYVVELTSETFFVHLQNLFRDGKRREALSRPNVLR